MAIAVNTLHAKGACYGEALSFSRHAQKCCFAFMMVPAYTPWPRRYEMKAARVAAIEDALTAQAKYTATPPVLFAIESTPRRYAMKPALHGER